MAVTQKFRRCHEVTAKWEGGWSNHAADPGGKTMYGVTEAVYHAWLRKQGRPSAPVRGITRADAEAIYFEEYWKPSGGPTLAEGVDLATYDASVNSGVSRGRKWLLAALDPQNRHHETVKKLCAKRLGFMRSLAIWNTFGNGWSNRVADIQAKGVAWALTAANDNAAVKQQLEDEADQANKTAKQQQTGAATSGAGGAGAGGAGTTGVDQAVDIPAWLPWGVAAVLIALAAFLLIKAVQKRQQAKAYQREAAAIAP